MNPEAQRIAIAEACGWKLLPTGKPDSNYWNKGEPPQFLSDLNAMHEAEKTIIDSLWSGYVRTLRAVCGDPQSEGYCCYNFAHATAAQRAEAFLKTKGLWKDGI